MNKQIVIYPYDEILLKNKKKWSFDTCENMDESQNHHAEWKNLDQKKKKKYVVYLHLYKVLQTTT